MTEVNDTWMTDSGRELYKIVEAEDRLTACSVAGDETAGTEAIVKGETLQGGKTAIVGSGQCSVEEQYA